jgi:NADP-dependent 3-hydroxy acid dehydrogenase YdfG
MLAPRGVRLGLIARSAPDVEDVVNEVRRLGSVDSFAIPADVRQEGQVGAAIKLTLERFGRIDVLVNSAGLSLNGEVESYSLDDWRTVIDTNLTGTFLMCRGVLPGMRKNRLGRIINISSGAGRNGIKQMAAYCASKFGVIGFSEALSLEVRSDNIQVSVLLPGSVATGFSGKARRKQGAKEALEIGYAMLPEEVAGIIVALLEQPDQAWISEVVVRPLNLEISRTSGER